MKKDKLTLIFYIAAALAALFDIAYIVFIAVEYTLVLTGARFISSVFPALSLSAIVINAASLVFVAVYFFMRRRGTVIK